MEYQLYPQRVVDVVLPSHWEGLMRGISRPLGNHNASYPKWYEEISEKISDLLSHVYLVLSTNKGFTGEHQRSGVNKEDCDTAGN